jgi:hypothetical protein
MIVCTYVVYNFKTSEFTKFPIIIKYIVKTLLRKTGRFKDWYLIFFYLLFISFILILLNV